MINWPNWNDGHRELSPCRSLISMDSRFPLLPLLLLLLVDVVVVVVVSVRIPLLFVLVSSLFVPLI